jgi:hypothetical protein
MKTIPARDILSILAALDAAKAQVALLLRLSALTPEGEAAIRADVQLELARLRLLCAVVADVQAEPLREAA